MTCPFHAHVGCSHQPLSCLSCVWKLFLKWSVAPCILFLIHFKNWCDTVFPQSCKDSHKCHELLKIRESCLTISAYPWLHSNWSHRLVNAQVVKWSLCPHVFRYSLTLKNPERFGDTSSSLKTEAKKASSTSSFLCPEVPNLTKQWVYTLLSLLLVASVPTEKSCPVVLQVLF